MHDEIIIIARCVKMQPLYLCSFFFHLLIRRVPMAIAIANITSAAMTPTTLATIKVMFSGSEIIIKHCCQSLPIILLRFHSIII